MRCDAMRRVLPATLSLDEFITHSYSVLVLYSQIRLREIRVDLDGFVSLLRTPDRPLLMFATRLHAQRSTSRFFLASQFPFTIRAMRRNRYEMMAARRILRGAHNPSCHSHTKMTFVSVALFPLEKKIISFATRREKKEQMRTGGGARVSSQAYVSFIKFSSPQSSECANSLVVTIATDCDLRLPSASRRKHAPTHRKARVHTRICTMYTVLYFI